jgi:hypothetical protein
MKKDSSKYFCFYYSILELNGLTPWDKIVLAYNRSFDSAGGYFASSKYAAGVLRMNIKTFEKSVTKLKKLGLWKVRGKVVTIRGVENTIGTPPPTGGTLASQEGNSPSPGGDKTPRGVKITPNLPLKNEVLLDNSLDSQLESDKKEILNSASEAANLPSGSLSIEELFMKTFYEGTSFKNTGSAYPTNSTNLDGRTVLANDSTYAVSTCSLVVPPKAEGARFLSDLDMVKQNLEAWRHGHAEPFTNQDIAAARNLVNYTKPEDGLRN